jgi:hypothetical protein
MDIILTTLIGGSIGLVWATHCAFKSALERRSGLLWGIYCWAGAPAFFAKFGRDERADSLLEIGIRGRVLYLFRAPKG